MSNQSAEHRLELPEAIHHSSKKIFIPQYLDTESAETEHALTSRPSFTNLILLPGRKS